MERLVLIGFMGCGKTTLGRLLAAKCGAEFVDLDAELEVESGRTIRDLIVSAGEPEFRRLELAALRRIVERPAERLVVATGGGIVETPASHVLLRARGTVVWLRADPAVCVARLAAVERAARPLLDSGEDWRARYARREPIYLSLADHVVETYPQPVEASLAQLETCLRSRRPCPP